LLLSVFSAAVGGTSETKHCDSGNEGWTAESFPKWYKTWNIRDEDTAKLMQGIYKTGVLDGETKGSASRP
jgi:hypothetical protein